MVAGVSTAGGCHTDTRHKDKHVRETGSNTQRVSKQGTARAPPREQQQCDTQYKSEEHANTMMSGRGEGEEEEEEEEEEEAGRQAGSDAPPTKPAREYSRTPDMTTRSARKYSQCRRLWNNTMPKVMPHASDVSIDRLNTVESQR